MGVSLIIWLDVSIYTIAFLCSRGGWISICCVWKDQKDKALPVHAQTRRRALFFLFLFQLVHWSQSVMRIIFPNTRWAWQLCRRIICLLYMDLFNVSSSFLLTNDGRLRAVEGVHRNRRRTAKSREEYMMKRTSQRETSYQIWKEKCDLYHLFFWVKVV